MAKFKALYSPTQMFSFGGVSYQFADGYFHTDNEELVAFLKDNHGCTLVEEPKAEVVIELPKKPKKVSK